MYVYVCVHTRTHKPFFKYIAQATGMLPTKIASLHEQGLLTEDKKKKKKEEKSLTYMTVEQLQENACTFASSFPRPYSLTAI